MKRVIYATLISLFFLGSAEGNKAFFGTATYAQSKKKEKIKEDESDKESENEKDKAKEKTKTKGGKKSTEKEVKQEEAPVENKNSADKKNNGPKLVNVMAAYHELPLDHLMQIKNYIQRKKEENPRDRTVDGKDLRNGFVKDKDLYRGYLHLQWPGDVSYTRLQFFQSKDRDVNLMAVETYECRPSCRTTFALYERDTTGWHDVTATKLPQLDMRAINKKVKEAYREQFTDLDVWDSYGYNNENTLKDALEYTISADEKKILVREPKLQLDVYEIAWDENRNVLFGYRK